MPLPNYKSITFKNITFFYVSYTTHVWFKTTDEKVFVLDIVRINKTKFLQQARQEMIL
jgi:hypothetical protein